MTMNMKNSAKDDSWSSDTKYALGYYRLLGRGLGIWPVESQGMGPKVRIFFVAVTQLHMSVSLIGKWFSSNCGEATELVDVLSLILCGFLTVMKVVVPKIQQQNMLIVVNSAVNDWSTVTDERSRAIMMRYAYIGRLVFIIQISGAYVAGFPLIFFKIPFISALWSHNNDSIPSRQIPIGPSCWIPDDTPTYYYVFDYILQSVQLFIVCTAYIGCDTYFFGIAMHVCGQFELLYNSLDDMYSAGNVVQQKQKFANFVKRHNHLLKLLNTFEEIYNMIILAQVAGDTLLICISGIVLLMSLESGNIIIIAGLIVRIYLVHIQLFMYSYVGDNLTTKAENLRMAVYNCRWYNMPRSIIHNLTFVIMRNDYGFNLTAGNMYSMNIANFKNMLKTIFSYFSVLRLIFVESQ